MIRVHCFVSCLCDLLNRAGDVDERPFYFGVWDADFLLTEEHVLSYHSDGDHSFFRSWYERLYGVPVRPWYDWRLSKQENIARLIELLGDRPADRSIMVMLDLYRLPERENKFNQNPFPHYVMLEATADPAQWRMKDPDFRWEGELSKVKILDAISQPSVGGGYYFDGRGLTHPTDSVVRSYFLACFKRDNPLTQAVRALLLAHVSKAGDLEVGGLTHALRELPVLAIRKYAYEHGFAFFWRALGLEHDDFLSWCDRVDKLVKGYTLVQYRAMKLVAAPQPELLQGVLSLLDELDALELRIKRGLRDAFELWCEQIDAGAGAGNGAAS